MRQSILAVGILLGLGACNFDPEQSYPVKTVRAKGQAAKRLAAIDKRTVERALELFRFDNGRYPTTQEGLKALIENPGLSGWRQYVTNPVAIQGLSYESDGSTFKLTVD